MPAVYPYPPPTPPPATKDSGMVLVKTLKGSIRPKSIVHSGHGLFFAQNMMYRHTITVYNRDMKLVKTIPDRVDLSRFGLSSKQHWVKGSPVESAFTHDGQYAWVSNYEMTGRGFNHPGTDKCVISQEYDHSYVYQVDVKRMEVIGAVEVGCVPKYLAATPDSRYVLVSNWCSGDLSIIDTELKREVRRIYLGRYPRGIAIDREGKYAYVGIMGSNKIARVDLTDYHISWLRDIGQRPRHLCLDPGGKYLYASLNSEGKVVKIELPSGKVLGKTFSGRAPRSMVLTADGAFLYVVNYLEDNLCKIRTSDMKVLRRVETHHKPIGITLDDQSRKIWVACYPGSIMVFEDKDLPLPQPVAAPAGLLAGPELPSWDAMQARWPQWQAHFVDQTQLLALQQSRRSTPASPPPAGGGPFPPAVATQDTAAVPPDFHFVAGTEPPPEPASSQKVPFEELQASSGQVVSVAPVSLSRQAALLPPAPEMPPLSLAMALPDWPQMRRQFVQLDTAHFTSHRQEVAFVGAEEELVESQPDAFVPPPAPDLRQPYLLIVGSFSRQANARQAVEEFSVRGFSPLVIPVSPKVFRVAIRSFDTHAAATAEKKRLLHEANISTWVLKHAHLAPRL